MNLFGENLQFYRKRDNLTQEQLAEMLEVSRQTVSKWKKYYRKRTSERFYYGILMCFMAVGLGILVYNGMRNDEYDVKKYNKENHLNVNNDAIAVWSGCIMIVATIIFLISGLIFYA